MNNFTESGCEYWHSGLSRNNTSRPAISFRLPHSTTWPLAAVLVSANAVGLTFGLTIPLVALILEQDGYSATWIGINASSAPIASILIAPFIANIATRIGIFQAMVICVVLSAILLCLFPVLKNIWFWLVLRFALGALGAVQWVLGEVWIIALAGRLNRGKIIGLYVTLVSIGFALGPQLITLFGVDGPLPFIAAACFMLLSVLPILAVRKNIPEPPQHTKASYLTITKAAPLIVFAACLAGFIDTSMMSFLHIFGLRNSLPMESALLMLTVVFSGTIVLQIPIGWLADKFNRHRLLLIHGILLFVIPLAVMVMFDTFALWPVLFLWGGLTMGIYTVALTLLGDRFKPIELAAANAVFVAVYEIGSLGGPLSSGISMDLFGAQGLMIVYALSAALFLITAIVLRLKSV